MSKKIIIFQVIILAVLGVLFAVYMGTVNKTSPAVVVDSRSALSTGLSLNRQASLINPAVIADLKKHYIINFKPLRERLNELQKKEKDKTFVYFLYLNNAAWIGINERELFPAASTIKVPLAMSIYKMKEQGKIKLSQTYSLSELDLDSNFGSLYEVGPDQTFTIEDLLRIMLQYSDNTAARALLHITESIGIKDPFVDIYDAMGWEDMEFENKPVYIDINLKILSNMFIALYNASYINSEDSIAILSQLSRSPFDQQIVGGLPKTVPVAHKIGIDDVEESYSDCGIVYAPNRPYILCLGYYGGSKVLANKFMSNISKEVYGYVINN